MKEENAIIQVEPNVQLGSLQVQETGVVARATAIADELAEIITSRKLFSNINNKKYVRVEGWSTLGALLGVLPVEDAVKEHENGDFEASVNLIRVSDGSIIGRGSAIVGSDEPMWAKRPRYARRSMAITRATGKAFRLGFSWIVQLAGFEATPAEEMDGIVDANFSEVSKPAPAKKAKPKGRALEAGSIEAIVKLGLAENDFAATNAIKKSNFTGKVSIDEAVEWMTSYRGARDEGMTSDDAAELANIHNAKETQAEILNELGY